VHPRGERRREQTHRVQWLAQIVARRRQKLRFAAIGRFGHTPRAIRGGSWSSLPVFVRSAARSGSDRGDKDTDYSSLTGFRVARDLP